MLFCAEIWCASTRRRLSFYFLMLWKLWEGQRDELNSILSFPVFLTGKLKGGTCILQIDTVWYPGGMRLSTKIDCEIINHYRTTILRALSRTCWWQSWHEDDRDEAVTLEWHRLSFEWLRTVISYVRSFREIGTVQELFTTVKTLITRRNIYKKRSSKVEIKGKVRLTAIKKAAGVTNRAKKRVGLFTVTVLTVQVSQLNNSNNLAEIVYVVPYQWLILFIGKNVIVDPIVRFVPRIGDNHQ